MISDFFAPVGKRSPNSTKQSSEDSPSSNRKRQREEEEEDYDDDKEKDGDEDHNATSEDVTANRAKRPAKAAAAAAASVVVCEEVQEILQYLNDYEAENGKDAGTRSEEKEDEGKKVDEATWKDKLKLFASSTAFAKLTKFVAKERLEATVFPPSNDVFSALNLTPLSKVKVVIVGQDPYHGPNQAHGLCFSVRKGVRTPPSLNNIYRELANDPDVDVPWTSKSLPRHGNLERWAQQGVLMLNAVLTVRKAEPNSHSKRGWESFTDEIIRIVDQYAKDRNRPLVFLLWGKPASLKATSNLRGGGSSSRRTTIIQTSHPSPLGASKTSSPFLGSRCFSRANKALVDNGIDPIDWNVDD